MCQSNILKPSLNGGLTCMFVNKHSHKKSKFSQFLPTSLGVNNPAIGGPTMPGIVAKQLVIPIRNPEYLGAISM